MTSELSTTPVSTNRGIVIHMPSLPSAADVDTMNMMCKIVAYSGLLSSTSEKAAQRAADAFFVMALGREIGIPAITALRLIYVIDGKPSMSGQGMLGLLRKAGFKVIMPNPGKVADSATVTITRPDDEPREYTYTLAMADRAGLLGKKNWKNHPAEMLCWRALATGAKMEGSDVINGLQMIEEIAPDVEVDEMGVPTHPVPTRIVREDGQEFAPSPSPSEEPALDGEIIDPVEKAGAAPEQGKSGQGEQPGQGGNGQQGKKVSNHDWADKKTIPALIQEITKQLGVKPNELTDLIGIKNLNSVEEWNKHKSGQAAFDAIKVARDQKRATNAQDSGPGGAPAVDQPANKNAPATQPVTTSRHQWTKTDHEEMDDRSAGWYDMEQKFPMMSDTILVGINQPGWSSYKNKPEAQNSIVAYAREKQLPMVAIQARYMGQYTEFTNSYSQITVRLYGAREELELRKLGEDWSKFVDTWEEGKLYDLTQDDRELVLEWEQENGYAKVTSTTIMRNIAF